MIRSIRFTRFWLQIPLLIPAIAACLSGKGMPGPNNPDVPFTFVENRGQADPRVRYIGAGPEFRAWFEDRGVVLRNSETTVRFTFERLAPGAKPTITAGPATGAHASYMQGKNPALWQANLPLVSSIVYRGLWPGVDLKYEAEQSRIKAEYLVAPGASVDAIRLRFDARAEIASDGSLCVETASADFIEHSPILYQTINGVRKVVAGGFRLTNDGSVGFYASVYDKAEPLVIDPSMLFSGYFGGSSQDNITAVKIDGLNNIVVVGWTTSSDLPTSNGARKVRGGGVDAFVASFLPNGGGLLYCTYLGGAGDDRAFGLAIDASRNVYITGWTSSTNFPLVGAFQSRLGGTRDAFVTKLNATGNTLLYSTYLGGTGLDVGNSIAVTSANEAVLCGDTTSTNLPVTPGVFQRTLGGSQDAWVARLSPAGNSLVFLTYVGGSSTDHCSVIATGTQNEIVFGGYTWSANFPTAGMVTPVFQPASGGGQDGFVAKIYRTGALLIFSTYLGGSGGSIAAPEEVNSLAIDSQGNIVSGGTTSSSDFPVTSGAFQSKLGGQTDGFITRFGSFGNLLQSTYLGGALSDSINGVALDFHGNPYVTGSTASQDFPVANPLQTANAGGADAFVVKMNTALSSVTYGSYLGGAGGDSSNAIAVDFETSIVLAGQTGSGNFPVSGNLPRSSNEVLSSFLTKIAPSFTLGVAYGYQGQQEFVIDSWHVSSYLSSASYGNATDIPLVGDWTGSGTKHIGVFRNGTWILDTNGNGILDATDKTVVFGEAGDVPVVGDWRGTGQIALGLFRQGTFILDLSGHLSGTPTGLNDATFAFGQGGDLPIAADWSGTGTTKVGIFRNGLWIVDYSGGRTYNSSTNQAYIYGQAGDIPIVGDWDSSGNSPKIGVYRAGLWILDYDGDRAWTIPYVNEMVIPLGFTGYTPLVF